MKFVDFFSGIGGFRLGMEMAGHECVGHCEIDKYADKSYRAMHNVKENEFYAADITRIEPGDLPSADIYCGGFPCQSFSIAGKRGGFEDTRGTLFFEVMRLAVIRKPTYLFLENVKGLLSHDNGNTFATILESLWECGYHAEWQVLNSKDFGVPQNRERVFIIGHLGNTKTRSVFPILQSTGGILKSIQADTSGKEMDSQQDRFYMIDGISPCLPHARAKTKCCVCDYEGNLHILTAKERMRVQGFPDSYTDAVLKVVDESTLCEQAGNSVTVNVIHEIAKRF